MATYSVNWSAVLASTSGTIAAGTCLVQNSSGTHLAGTSANRATYGRCVGIASTAGDAATPTVTLIEAGIVPASITGLAAGTESWVRVSSTGTLERVTPGSGDDIIGKAHLDGSVQLSPGVWDSDNYAGGAGATLPIDLATDVTGTLPVANGGTGLTALASGLTTFWQTPSGANLAAVLSSALPGASVTAATGSLSGSMSAADKTKLDAMQLQGATIVVAAYEIDWALGDGFSKTIAAGAQAFTFANATDGQCISVAVTGSASTLSWSGVLWAGGIAPTQTASGTDIYTFWKAGSTIFGSFIQDMS